MTRSINPTRLKFELIDQQFNSQADRSYRGDNASPLAQLSARLRREEQPRQPQRPRMLHDLAEGLDFLIGQLIKAEEERDAARAEAGLAKTEFQDLQRQIQIATESATELRETRKTLEGVVGEQQKALLLSMELMHRFESEISLLRQRVDAIDSAPPAKAVDTQELTDLRTRAELQSSELNALQARVQDLEAGNQRLDAEKKELAARHEAQQSAAESLLQELNSLRSRAESLENTRQDLEEQLRLTTASSNEQRETVQKRLDELVAKLAPGDPAELQLRISALETEVAQAGAIKLQLDTALEESAKLREQLAEMNKLGDPAAAIRALEEQRDLARADAASARADLAIQSAELDTKEALINALERALEQQHGSLRNLEERFAEYATKLQELRIDRLRMPDSTGALPDGAAGVKPSLGGRFLDAFKRSFSPSKPPVIEPTEESPQ